MGLLFLLLPLFRVLNPRFVKTSYAVVLFPRRDEIVKFTEIWVLERKPLSGVNFILKFKDKILASIDLVKVSDGYWFGRFPSNIPANLYNAELIFGVDGEVEKI